MNTKVASGTFCSAKRFYRSKDGRYYFDFKIVDKGNHYNIYCTRHPGFNGHSSNPRKTHLFESGKLCFVSGREPRSQARAEQLAAQWAEYFLEYRRTGTVQK